MGFFDFDLKNLLKNPLVNPIGATSSAMDDAEQGAYGGYEDTAVSPELTARVQESATRAGRSPAQYQAELMRGVGQDNLTASRQPASIGSDDSGFGEAIRARASKRYESDINKLARKGESVARQNKFQELSAAQSQAAQLDQINQMRVNRANIVRDNAKAARNQVLTNVLGMAGTIGGAVIGGPSGASVGGQAGKMGGAQAGSSEFQQLPASNMSSAEFSRYGGVA